MILDLHGKTTDDLGEIIAGLIEERDYYKRELGFATTTDMLTKLRKRWKLSPQEATCLALLYNRKGAVVRQDAFMAALYPNGDEAEIKIVNVLIWRLRNHMGGHDYVGTVWATGYFLTPMGVEAVTAALLVGSC